MGIPVDLGTVRLIAAALGGAWGAIGQGKHGCASRGFELGEAAPPVS